MQADYEKPNTTWIYRHTMHLHSLVYLTCARYVTTSQKFSPKNKRDLVMTCHTPPPGKTNKGNSVTHAQSHVIYKM